MVLDTQFFWGQFSIFKTVLIFRNSSRFLQTALALMKQFSFSKLVRVLIKKFSLFWDSFCFFRQLSFFKTDLILMKQFSAC